MFQKLKEIVGQQVKRSIDRLSSKQSYLWAMGKIYIPDTSQAHEPVLYLL